MTRLIPKTSNFLDYGFKGKILQKFSNCHTCYIKKYCERFKGMTDIEKNLGCNDIREVWVQALKRATKPEALIAETIAELDLKLALSDGMNGLELSPNVERLLKFKKEFLELQLKHNDIKLKYTVGEKKNLNITHDFKEDEVWDIGESGTKG